MSWLFSAAMADQFWPENSLDGKPSAQLSVMPTQHKFSRFDKTIDYSQLSRFGLTCEVLSQQDGEALLTSFQRVSPARTFPSPEQGKDWTESEVDSGPKLCGLVASFDPATSGWRTAQCSLLEGSEEFLETFPEWGTTRNGELYLLPTPARITFDSESGYLPTPVASMHKGSSIKSLTRKDGRSRLRDRLDHYVYATEGGRLNPEFVEVLMGLPIGWTDLKPLETDKSPSAQPLPGES